MRALAVRLGIAALWVIGVGCGEEPKPPPAQPPTITSFSPTSGPVGTPVQIVGTNFSTTGFNIVKFNGVEGLVSSATATTINVKVPEGATTGKITVSVLGLIATSAEDFEVKKGPPVPPTKPPTITSFTPINGPVGTKVTITGTHFAETALTDNTVTLGGALCTLSSATETQIEITVPENAVTGPIKVQTVAGSYTTKEVFTVSKIPAAPGSPSATAVGGSQVNISWALSAGATGYNIYRSTTAGVAVSAQNRITPSPVPNPPYADTAVTSGTKYYYVVTALNDNGESKASAEVSATPTTSLVPTITSFSPTNGTVDTIVTILGTNFAPQVQDNTVTFNGVPAVVSSATTSELKALVPPSATTGKITVTTAAGSAQSASPFTVLKPQPPTITSFAPTNGAVGATVVIYGLDFAPIAAANTVTFNGVVAPVSAATATQITTSVPIGASSGLIRVTTAAGTATSSASFTVLMPPAAPLNVTAVPISPTQVNLGWSTVSGATGYNVYRSTSPGVAVVAGNKVTATPVAAPPFSNTSLVTGTTYYYVVTAVSANGESAASKEVSAMPTTPPPAPPTIASFTPTNGTPGTVVTIAGTDFSAVATNNTVTFNGTPAEVTAATTTSLTVKVPVGATTGPIKVITAAGQATSATPFTVMPMVPVAPGGLTAVAGVGQVTLTWQPVTGATSYNLYFTTGTTPPSTSGTKLASVTSPYKHSNLTTNLAYNYVVTAVNTAGESAPSAPASATPAIPVIVARLVSGIPQTILQNNVQISVKDNLGAPLASATVVLNGTTLAYDSSKQQYKGYLNVPASGPVTFSVTINGSTYSLPAGISQFSSYPKITLPLDGAQAPAPIDVKWDPGAPLTGAYNYGIILFDTVSINPYWENFLYWNNFISPALANPGNGSTVPSMAANSGNVALFVYINRTETITLGGTAGGVSVGSIDIIGASTPITIITK